MITIIIPLIKEYNLKFLTKQRILQFNLLNHILDKNIVHWEDVKCFAWNNQNVEKNFTCYSVQEIRNLSFFNHWLIGFTIAEGSFFFKNDRSAFFQIKQKGLENYNIIKAIALFLANKEINVKPDSANCYQLSLSSKLDIQKVINFFSSDETKLYGYKLIQYNNWLLNLKNLNRYKEILIPNNQN